MNDLLRQLIQDVVDSASIGGNVAIVDLDAFVNLSNYLAANPPFDQMDRS